MRTLGAAFLAVGATVLIVACGAARQSSDPRADSVSPTPTPTTTASTSAPSAPAPTSSPSPTQLTISGPLTDVIELPQTAGTCTVIPGGFEAQIPFTSAGTSYEVDIQILDYTGPGTYQTPPEPVAVHTVGSSSPSALYPMVSGTVTVSSTQQSGTVDGSLGGGGKPGKLDGTWACS